MSGHKRALITLSESDLRKLAGLEDRLRHVEQDYHDIRQQARQEQDTVLFDGLHALHARQQALQSALSGLDDGLAEVEARASQALIAQAGLAQAELAEQLCGLGEVLWQESAARWQEATDLLSSQQSELQALVADSQAARLEQLQHLEAHLQADWDARCQAAQQALLCAEALLAALEATPSYERCFPSQASAHHSALELAHTNLASGLAEASLAASQQAYLHLSQQRMELEAILWKRSGLLASALGRAQEIYQRGLRLAQVPAIDLDGQELPVQVEVEYWSGGLFSHALAQCQAYVELLVAGAQSLDEADLVDLLNLKLPALAQALDEAVFQARRRVLASQLRFNLAECVVQALSQQGFALQGGGYLGSDPRQQYRAHVRHLDGSEVVVQVSPVDDEIGASQVDLLSLDGEQRSAHELRQRAREIAQALLAYGLQVGRGGDPPQASYAPLPYPAPPRQVAERQQVPYGRD